MSTTTRTASMMYLSTFPLKTKRPPGHAPPEKAFECLVRLRLCLRWAKNYAYPGSIPHSPPEGLSIAEAPGGVKTLRQAAPWLSRAGLQTPGKITTTNPWLRLPIPRGGTGLPWRVTGGWDCQGGCVWVAFSGQEMVCFAASCTPNCLKLLNLLYQGRHSKCVWRASSLYGFRARMFRPSSSNLSALA